MILSSFLGSLGSLSIKRTQPSSDFNIEHSNLLLSISFIFIVLDLTNPLSSAEVTSGNIFICSFLSLHSTWFSEATTFRLTTSLESVLVILYSTRLFVQKAFCPSWLCITCSSVLNVISYGFALLLTSYNWLTVMLSLALHPAWPNAFIQKHMAKRNIAITCLLMEKCNIFKELVILLPSIILNWHIQHKFPFLMLICLFLF